MNPAPNWYDDPHDPRQWRYWDGTQWTTYTVPKSAHQQSSGAPALQRNDLGSGSGGRSAWVLITCGVVAVLAVCAFSGLAMTSEGPSDTTTQSEATRASETTTDAGPTDSSTAETTTPDEEPAEDTTTSTTSSSSTTEEPEPAPTADVKVTAGELIDEFESNELAGDEKYAGKMVEVSGVVEEIDTDLFSSDEYLLDITDGGEYEFLSVTCYDMDTDVLAELNVGDPVTVIGDFGDGGDLGVTLKNCSVV